MAFDQNHPTAAATADDSTATPSPAASNQAIGQAPPPIRQAIEELSQQWRRAFDNREAAAAAALYAHDAVLMPPFPPPSVLGEGVVGREAIQAFVQAYFDVLVSKDDVTTTEVLLLGPAAAERGTWSATHVDGDGTTKVEGFYLRVWQRDRGEWRIAREAFN